MPNTERVADLQAAVARILERCGNALTVCAPLALGKPNELLNALYAAVRDDPRRSMTLYTALSLARPAPKPGLEARFAGPFVARQFGADYPDLQYVLDLREGSIPDRVRVHEFYFQSGAWLANPRMQRDYASINYTHVAREVAARDPNLIVQLVARRGDRLSLSCNTDVTLDLLDLMARAGKPRPLVALVVHPDLPFLGHDAVLPPDFPCLLLEQAGPAHKLFALPREPVLDAEYALGLHASSLVVDGGTLQIGIGALSDALVHALLLRERDNASYRGALAALRAGEPPAIVREWGDEAPFARGLYGASELVMDGFMHLRRAGVLRRRVFDDLELQRLLNSGAIGETADETSLERFIEAGWIAAALDRPSLERLVRFGLVDEGATLAQGELLLADGTRISADLLDPDARKLLAQGIAGRRLRNGRYLHGAFYLGSTPLYDWLRTLEGEDYEGLAMTRVSYINELYGGREQLDIAQRHKARFFNTCMMHTLSGAAVSDGLANGLVVSGVGGQYNFVAMAHALPDARSVLMLRSTRESGAEAGSNIVWSYAHATIPRHLRDLVVTEYGIADLRGASDGEVVERLLAITDARFVDGLAQAARSAGKLAPDFRVPDAWRRNNPAALKECLRPWTSRNLFPRYPFGSDFDELELALMPALKRLKAATATRRGRLATVARALVSGAPTEAQGPLLARMGLDRPRGFGEKLQARLLAWALSETRSPLPARSDAR